MAGCCFAIVAAAEFKCGEREMPGGQGQQGFFGCFKIFWLLNNDTIV
jgi:hypothetical protein